MLFKDSDGRNSEYEDNRDHTDVHTLSHLGIGKDVWESCFAPKKGKTIIPSLV